MATKRREPAVISLALITTALEEEANERPVESSVARPAIKLDEAASLQLSFRSEKQWHAPSDSLDDRPSFRHLRSSAYCLLQCSN